MDLLAPFRRKADGGGAPVPTRPLAPAIHRRPLASYLRGGLGTINAQWRPVRLSDQDEIAIAADPAAARAADAAHNSAFLTGAIEQVVANTVGTGLRLKPAPEHHLIGWTAEEGRAWSRQVARLWEIWSRTPRECDLLGQRTVGQMAAALFQHWIMTGEHLSEFVLRTRPDAIFRTKIRLLASSRLSRRSSQTDRLIHGVYVDADGAPIAYQARRPHRGAAARYAPRYEEIAVPARGPYGRPRVVHVFSGPPETYRGITILAPVLLAMRQYDQLAEATLMAAMVQSMYAAAITSDASEEELFEGLLTPEEQAAARQAGTTSAEAYLEVMAAFVEGSGLDLGANGRVAILPPKTRLDFKTASHPNSAYAEQVAEFKRQVARVLGLPYEAAAVDNRGSSYATRGRSDEDAYIIAERRRADIVVPFYDAAYTAFLEEAIDLGLLDFPGGRDGFLIHRAAASRAQWLGQGRPIADEVKHARAAEIYIAAGLKSRSTVCGEMGLDYEDEVANMAEETVLLEEYDVPPPAPRAGAARAPAAIEDGTGGDDDDDA